MLPEMSSDTASDVAPLGAALPPSCTRDSAAIAASAAAAAGGRSAVHSESQFRTCGCTAAGESCRPTTPPWPPPAPPRQAAAPLWCSKDQPD